MKNTKSLIEGDRHCYKIYIYKLLKLVSICVYSLSRTLDIISQNTWKRIETDRIAFLRNIVSICF